jgi:hypothetical protein
VLNGIELPILVIIREVSRVREGRKSTRGSTLTEGRTPRRVRLGGDLSFPGLSV